MAIPQEMDDDLSAFEAKETSRKLPVGWLVLYFGLIAWGVWYLWAYTPALGGWSQAQDVESGGAAAGTNLLMTILFTALPTAVAIVIVLGQRRKK